MLVFYYQNTDKFGLKKAGKPRAFLADPMEDELTGACIYALRTADPKTGLYRPASPPFLSHRCS